MSIEDDVNTLTLRSTIASALILFEDESVIERGFQIVQSTLFNDASANLDNLDSNLLQSLLETAFAQANQTVFDKVLTYFADSSATQQTYVLSAMGAVYFDTAFLDQGLLTPKLSKLVVSYMFYPTPFALV